jgi:hypothetical protein
MQDLLFDLILLGLVFWAGYTWGKWTAVRRIIENIVNDPEHLGKALDQFRRVRTTDSDVTPEGDLIVERHGDQLYLYDREDGQFLAQGSTLESALELVGQRYPDRKYTGHLTREQADALAIKLVDKQP